MNDKPMPMPRAAGIIRPNTCDKCKFALPHPGQPGVFQCRRSSPTIAVFKFQTQNANVVEFKEYTTFPKVKAEEWCGDFRPFLEM